MCKKASKVTPFHGTQLATYARTLLDWEGWGLTVFQKGGGGRIKKGDYLKRDDKYSLQSMG